MHAPMTPPAFQGECGIELPVLHSIRTAVGRRFTTKLGVVVHNLAHQLLNHLRADDAVLLARQFCDCLRDRVDHFIGFIGIDFVRRGPCRIFGEEIVGAR